MRLVPYINEITTCPQCGSSDLSLYLHNDPATSDYKKCRSCGEKIYTNERTFSEAEQHKVYHTKKFADVKEEQLEQKQKRKENFIFEMREEISNLDWNIHDSQTKILVENIQNIFNRIIDYIEEN